MQNSKVFYHFVAFIVVAIWGSTFVFTKLLLLGGLTAAQIFTLRFIIAYILMLGFCLYKGILWVAKCWQDEVLLAILGIAGGSLYFLAENNAMNYTTTTNTSLIVSLSPLFASALISLFYKSQRLNRIQAIGSLMAAVGVVMVVMNGHFVLHLSPKGDVLAFSAALCWAVYSLLMIYANAKYDTLFITRKVFFYGLLAMIPYFILYPGLGIQQLIGQQYARLRVGIGSEFARGAQVNYVLGRFDPDELEVLEPQIATAVDIIKSFVLAGVDITMNQYNKRKYSPPKRPTDGEQQ